MAKERVFTYRNTGTASAPVWEKWYQKTVMDAVMKSDSDSETETLQDVIDNLNAAMGKKVDKVTGKGLSSNDYTTAEKNKLAGLSNYTHPTAAGSKHIPAGGASGQILRWSADGTAVWGADNDTKYSKVTTSADGLMAKEDKVKLDGIETGANKYVHPNSGATAGTYKSVTVNAQGHVTGGTNPTTLAGYGITDAAPKAHSHGNADISGIDAGKITTGIIDIERLPKGALERCVVVADDTARFALTTADAQKGDTVKVSSTGLMYFIVDDLKLNVEDGYEVYTAGGATTVPWAGVTGKPSTFPPSTHNHAVSNVTGLQTALDGKVDKVTGKQLSTEDYTTTEKNKLAGIASGANNYVHPTSDGNKHVPVTGTTNNGKFLQAGSTAGAMQWAAVSKATVGLGNVDNTADANKPVSSAQQAALDKKVDKVTGKQLSTEDYTSAEKTKLAGIATGANNYVHPSSHAASMITQDATHRFVSDTEKAKWNEEKIFFASELPASAPAGAICFLI